MGNKKTRVRAIQIAQNLFYSTGQTGVLFFKLPREKLDTFLILHIVVNDKKVLIYYFSTYKIKI